MKVGWMQLLLGGFLEQLQLQRAEPARVASP